MASSSTQPADSSVAESETSSTVDRRRRLQDLGLVMLVGFAPLVISAVYRAFVPPRPTPGINIRFISGLINEIAILTLFVCLLRRQGRTLATVGLSLRWTDIPKGVGLFVLTDIGSYDLHRWFQNAYFFWNGNYFEFRDSSQLDAGAFLPLLLIYSFAAPLFEETLVRGYLMTELIESSFPVWMAVIASVILQTSYHLYYGVAGALFLSFGFLVSAIYFALSRRLMPVILAHLFWNLTTFLHWQG